MTSQECARFEQEPFFEPAIQLRLADDRGKSRDAASRSFADFLPLVRRVARNRSG